MKGVTLKNSIELFGFKQGFSFWFRWSFSDPIKMFYLKYIIGRPLCTYHGYFLCKPDCNAKKIYGRGNIYRYTKERHKEIDIQTKTVRGSETGICAFCSKEKGTEIIDDPNWDTLERWLVCKHCAEVIELQRELSFPLTSLERKEKINERLLEISKETGNPIFITVIDKKEGVSSVTYTGEK
jgi:hypothetical protein